MGKARKWLFLALACLGGCAKSDADRLARIAQKSGQKIDNLTGGMRGKVNNGWQAVRGSLNESSLDGRVLTRLHWDKQLANVDIQVKTTGPGTVELKGTVADGEQRRRALELANSTDGVVTVTDSLIVGPP